MWAIQLTLRWFGLTSSLDLGMKWAVKLPEVTTTGTTTSNVQALMLMNGWLQCDRGFIPVYSFRQTAPLTHLYVVSWSWHLTTPITKPLLTGCRPASSCWFQLCHRQGFSACLAPEWAAGNSPVLCHGPNGFLLVAPQNEPWWLQPRVHLVDSKREKPFTKKKLLQKLHKSCSWPTQVFIWTSFWMACLDLCCSDW